jgi:hypothetical protein
MRKTRPWDIQGRVFLILMEFLFIIIFYLFQLTGRTSIMYNKFPCKVTGINRRCDYA